MAEDVQIEKFGMSSSCVMCGRNYPRVLTPVSKQQLTVATSKPQRCLTGEGINEPTAWLPP